MSPERARVEARRRFGNVTATRERHYESGRALWLDHLIHDVRCAWRNVCRYPIASLVAILSLAAGIGATTVSLTVRSLLFHKYPPEYREPAELSTIQLGSPTQPIMPIGNRVPVALYLNWHDDIGRTIAAATSLGDRSLRTGSHNETVRQRAVTPELFEVLGVAPALGSPFSSTSTSGPAPAILSYRIWQQYFGERTDVLGEPFWLDNQPYVVTGVMPARFWFSDMDSPVWTVLDARRLPPDARVEVVARRPSGTSHDTLEARLQRGLLAYSSTLPAGEQQLIVKASGLEGTPTAKQMSFVLPYILGTAVLLTLIIACANVAILMIAQWTAREHEIAIRASIGATRSRIVRGLLTESLLIACCGAALGVLVTFGLRGWILHQSASGSLFDLSIDPLILIQTGIITLLCGVCAGIAPALYETRRLHINPIRTIATSDRVRQRWRHALVVLEIAVTVALLVVTSAMIDGYRRVTTGQVGYATAPLMTAGAVRAQGVPTHEILDTLARTSGVAAAAASTSVPTRAVGRRLPVSAEGGGESVTAERAEISDTFLSVLGVQIRQGRSFTKADSHTSRVAILSESLARTLFGASSPIGQTISIGDARYDVIGIVADYSSSPFRSGVPEPRVFIPLAPDSPATTRMSFLIRTHGPPAGLIKPIRETIRDVRPGEIEASAESVDHVIDIMGQEMMVGTAPLIPLVTIGILLTTAGIYGVLAFAIARRSREIAVRMAVGASPRDVVVVVAKHSLRLVLIGSASGIVVMAGLARLVRAGGGAGSIWDASITAFVAPVVILLAVGAIATWIPSRRALRIDPVALLRTQ
jgi:predicted permease